MLSLPDRLPLRISPCPIIEAIFEIRFSSNEPWATLPGLFFGSIRERFPEQVLLPLAQVPEQIRTQDPSLLNLPLMQFKGTDFLVQLGPRVVSLVTAPNRYPGWPAIELELIALLARVNKAGFVQEIERLGVRYVDFFGNDIFPNLRLDVRVDAAPLEGTTKDLTTVLHFPPISTRLHVTNGAIVNTPNGPQIGSIVDIDGWVGPQDAGPPGEEVVRFSELHRKVKQLFFGLLKPSYLETLSPAYP